MPREAGRYVLPRHQPHRRAPHPLLSGSTMSPHWQPVTPQLSQGVPFLPPVRSPSPSRVPFCAPLTWAAKVQDVCWVLQDDGEATQQVLPLCSCPIKREWGGWRQPTSWEQLLNMQMDVQGSGHLPQRPPGLQK